MITKTLEMTDSAVDTTETAEIKPLPTESFPAQVWNKLSRIDVGDHIKTAEIKSKTGASYSYQYLPWSWCWATLMSHYPESKIKILPYQGLDGGSVMVWVKLTIIEGKNSVSRKQHLPVMDQKNNAIINPTSRHISDTIQRCFVKAAAVCGLGLDLWTKTDYPVGIEDDPLDEEQFALLDGLFFKLNEENQAAFTRWLGPLSDLPKKKYGEARKGLESKLQQQGKQ